MNIDENDAFLAGKAVANTYLEHAYVEREDCKKPIVDADYIAGALFACIKAGINVDTALVKVAARALGKHQRDIHEALKFNAAAESCGYFFYGEPLAPGVQRYYIGMPVDEAGELLEQS